MQIKRIRKIKKERIGKKTIIKRTLKFSKVEIEKKKMNSAVKGVKNVNNNNNRIPGDF